MLLYLASTWLSAADSAQTNRGLFHRVHGRGRQTLLVKIHATTHDGISLPFFGDHEDLQINVLYKHSVLDEPFHPCPQAVLQAIPPSWCPMHSTMQRQEFLLPPPPCLLIHFPPSLQRRRNGWGMEGWGERGLLLLISANNKFSIVAGRRTRSVSEFARSDATRSLV